jgi:hypothetical protein
LSSLRPVSAQKSLRSQRYDGIRNEFEPFDVGDKVVVILESEYDQLVRKATAYDGLVDDAMSV